jgi:hypothetical protein
MADTTIYTMCVRGYEGAEPDPRFTFSAKDKADAESKGLGWARYHGFTFYTDSVNSDRSDVVVREATAYELKWQLHNEYVS